MGDLSAEPSMEEILSSIKRIIAEEGDTPGRRARPGRAAAAAAPVSEPDEPEAVLELSEPMPVAPRADPPPRPAPEPRRAAATIAPAAPAAEAIVGQEAAAASRGSLEALSRMMVKPEPGNDGTLEGMVREMLRPMLREWLDAHLPDMVESLVSREIARIAGQAR